MGILTSDMSKEMLGMTTAQHRELKGVGKSADLRNNMDNLELAVTTLGERAAKAIIVAQDTKTYPQTRKATMTGAKVAGDAARQIEAEIGRKIANKSNFLPKLVPQSGRWSKRRKSHKKLMKFSHTASLKPRASWRPRRMRLFSTSRLKKVASAPPPKDDKPKKKKTPAK